jgi:glycyl-tRNA synthetase beta chain
LCKADLTTGVVGEFPELQGVMGRYYALHEGMDAEIADAIRDHYKPLGPGDSVPTSPVSIAVALADKIDMLAGFFAHDERPTGSSDPYALRRAALGIIRLVLSAQLRLSLEEAFYLALTPIYAGMLIAPIKNEHEKLKSALSATNRPATTDGLYKDTLDQTRLRSSAFIENAGLEMAKIQLLFRDLLSFLADRLKVALKEKGTRHDLIDAVFSLGNEDDLVRLVARVEALQAFLKTDEGTNLLAGYKRAANILKIEEKKDKASYDGEPDPDAFVLPEEKALFVELATAAELVRAEIERERFVEAMGVMSRLRKPVDAFFEKVTVNDKDAGLRKNRLKLLSRLRATLHLAADFSKIEG